MAKNPDLPKHILQIPGGIPDLGRPRCNHQGWLCPTVLIPTKVQGRPNAGFLGKVKDFFIKPLVTVYLVQNAVCLNPGCNMIFTFGPPVQGPVQPSTGQTNQEPAPNPNPKAN